MIREFLLEGTLYCQAGLEDLPERIGRILGCATGDAVSQLTSVLPEGGPSYEELAPLFAIRDMSIISRTASSLAAELRHIDVSYDRCVQYGLIYALSAMNGHAFAALRAAATKNDDWARHHYIYGLIHGGVGAWSTAKEELDVALSAEPYADARARVREAIEHLTVVPGYQI